MVQVATDLNNTVNQFRQTNMTVTNLTAIVTVIEKIAMVTNFDASVGSLNKLHFSHLIIKQDFISIFVGLQTCNEFN